MPACDGRQLYVAPVYDFSETKVFCWMGAAGKSVRRKVWHESRATEHNEMIHGICELPRINRCGGNFYDDWK